MVLNCRIDPAGEGCRCFGTDCLQGCCFPTPPAGMLKDPLLGGYPVVVMLWDRRGWLPTE